MFQTSYFGFLTLEPWEFALSVFYLAAIWLLALYVRQRNIREHPEYRYYLTGMLAKVLGAIAVCLIYVYYYNGGDTTSYYESCLAMENLRAKNPAAYFHTLFGENTMDKMLYFDDETGYPLRYMFLDDQTFTVIRLTAPLLIVCFKSFLLQTITIAWLSYFGVWNLYRVFCHYFPGISGRLALAILFLPSVIFWGSGLLKDTITLAGTCWFVYGVHMVFFVKKRRVLFWIVLLISALVVVKVKPYIFLTLLPCSIYWIISERIGRIRNAFLRVMILPLLLAASVGGGLLILSNLGGSMSKFALDRVLITASVTQKDLRSDAYGEHSFDIGDFDPSVSGIISKAPIAITAGLFRPFLWECRNAVMIFSGLENLFILAMTGLILIRIRFTRLLKIFRSNPLLLFSVLFSILFAFSVGLTTPNFGALVRFKIPFLPFYVSALFILGYFMRNRKAVEITQQKKK